MRIFDSEYPINHQLDHETDDTMISSSLCASPRKENDSDASDITHKQHCN